MKRKKIQEERQVEIKVKVIPRSARNQIVGMEDNVYKVKTTAPPVDGQANNALIDLFAKKLGISKGNVEIVTGKRSRLKSIRIRGLSGAEIASLLKE